MRKLNNNNAGPDTCNWVLPLKLKIKQNYNFVNKKKIYIKKYSKV